VLTIVTESAETTWLIFILEEFKRINRADFAIRVLSLGEVSDEDKVIFYTGEYSRGCCIPNRSSLERPNSRMHWLDSDLFVMADTLTDDARFAVPYDLLYNAFVFLSRREEYFTEKNGGRIHSYSRRHPRQDLATFGSPVVNHLFDRLEDLIVRQYPELKFRGAEPPVIEWSHDVDYLEKTVQLRLKQTALNGGKLLGEWLSPSRAVKQLAETLSFLLFPAQYWCWDYWEALEKKWRQRSVFYVYIAAGKKDLLNWLLDPSYDVAASPKIQEKLRYLRGEGFEVGLHGSIRSATDEEQLIKEKTLLQNVLGEEVIKIRQHWLRYEERRTPALHSRYFQFDSTLGWNDRMGFRSGCVSRHRHFDHGQNKPYRHLITPLIIMDSHIYGPVRQREALSQTGLALIKILSRFKTSYVSINWHQRVCSPEYQWQAYYEKLLTL